MPGESANAYLRQLKAERLRIMMEESLRLYQPHKKQFEFHNSKAGVRGLFAANQAGKSYAGAMEIAWTVGGVHPFRPNYVGAVFGRDCCESFPVARAVLIPTYERLLPRKKCKLDGFTYTTPKRTLKLEEGTFTSGGDTFTIPDKTPEGKERIWPGLKGGSWDSAYDKVNHIIYLANGSFIELKVYEQGYQSFAGPARHIIRMDEEPPEQISDENMARQITTGTNRIYTMTPLEYSQWLYNRIYAAAAGNDRIDIFQMGAVDNPYANLDTIMEMDENLTDPAMRGARMWGEFTYLQGRVYKEYGEHNFIDPFPISREWHRSVIIDPHDTKPTAGNWVAEDNEGRLFCYDEGDFSGDVQHIANEIATKCVGQYIDLWLMDPSANREGKIHGKGKLINEFRKYFRNIIPANNNRELGWDAVRALVKDNPGSGPKLFVFKTCPVTHFQMLNYSWKPPTKSGEDRTKAEVFKKDDDHPDNIRYRALWRATQRDENVQPWRIEVYANG